MNRKLRSLKVVAAALVVVFVASGFRYTGFNDPDAKATAATAATWLDGKQLADGSFETAGFPGFETPDAILAIAENAQTRKNWNPFQARLAVLNTTNGGNNPLHAIDDLVDAGVTAGQAAKIVMLVVDPLRLSPSRFDPDNDGAVNLKATIVAGLLPDGSYGAGVLNATLYAMLALRSYGARIQPQTLAYLRSTQESSGGFDFAGDSAGNDADVDTTALAVQALVAAKVRPTDSDLMQALAYLAHQHRANGAWQSFGGDDANSTSTAIIAITAAGFDPTKPCWRNVAIPTFTGDPYTSPVTWLRSQQAVDGHIASQFDFGNPNTFATSQSIQALRRGYLPIVNLHQKKSLCP